MLLLEPVLRGCGEDELVGQVAHRFRPPWWRFQDLQGVGGVEVDARPEDKCEPQQPDRAEEPGHRISRERWKHW